jgi:hypothetical protein
MESGRKVTLSQVMEVMSGQEENNESDGEQE